MHALRGTGNHRVIVQTADTVRGGSMTLPADVYADLITEGEALDGLVAGLDAAQWALPTPALGWTITHQIAHLSSVAPDLI
jgi:hypothetical protein